MLHARSPKDSCVQKIKYCHKTYTLTAEKVINKLIKPSYASVLLMNLGTGGIKNIKSKVSVAIDNKNANSIKITKNAYVTINEETASMASTNAPQTKKLFHSNTRQLNNSRNSMTIPISNQFETLQLLTYDNEPSQENFPILQTRHDHTSDLSISTNYMSIKNTCRTTTKNNTINRQVNNSPKKVTHQNYNNATNNTSTRSIPNPQNPNIEMRKRYRNKKTTNYQNTNKNQKVV